MGLALMRRLMTARHLRIWLRKAGTRIWRISCAELRHSCCFLDSARARAGWRAPVFEAHGRQYGDWRSLGHAFGLGLRSMPALSALHGDEGTAVLMGEYAGRGVEYW